MEKIPTILLHATIMFLIICGLGYFVNGEIDWVIAIGAPFGLSIADLLIDRRR